MTSNYGLTGNDVFCDVGLCSCLDSTMVDMIPVGNPVRSTLTILKWFFRRLGDRIPLDSE